MATGGGGIDALTLRGGRLLPAGYRYSVASLLVCTLAISVLSLALPVMTLQVYDRILPNPGSGTLSVLTVGVCVAIALETALRLCRQYVIGRAGAAYEHRMACTAMSRILGADLNRMGSYGVGEHMNRMGAVARLKEFHNGYSLTVLAELAFVPLYLGLVIYIARDLAIVPALILAVFVLISLRRGILLRKALGEREKVDDRRFNFLIEGLEGVHTLKAFALEPFFERRYEKLEADSTVANYRVTQQSSSAFNAGSVFSHLMVAAVITAGAWFVLEGRLTSGALIATLLLSGRMMQPVQKALALWARYQDFTLARASVAELCATPQQRRLPRERTGERAPDGDLDIEGLCFRHAGAPSPVLSGIDLRLRRGETVLLSGAHGSGKSTLLGLVSGIYQAEAGRVLIDGEPVESYAPEELVRHVGFIRTRALIFRGTIRDNITSFGQTPESQAREIASLLGVDRDVARLPGGFDTFLTGSGTDRIPPGLKQRLAIVRAVAAKPRLILFDNADRALDKSGYERIYSLLARLRGKVSMILVSDDQNIRGLADRECVLAEGGLEQAGVAKVRAYRELRL